MFSFHLVFLQLINHDDDNYGIGKYHHVITAQCSAKHGSAMKIEKWSVDPSVMLHWQPLVKL